MGQLKGALTEFKSAIQAIDSGEAKGVVGLGVKIKNKKLQQVEGLPIFDIDDIDDIEADNLFIDLNGVITIREVKASPGVFSTTLKKESQFKRLNNWLTQGKDKGEKRKLTFFIGTSEPNFHVLFNLKTFTKLEEVIAPNNRKSTNFIMENQEFSYDELMKLKDDALDKFFEELLPEIQEVIHKQSPYLSSEEIN